MVFSLDSPCPIYPKKTLFVIYKPLKQVGNGRGPNVADMFSVNRTHLVSVKVCRAVTQRKFHLGRALHFDYKNARLIVVVANLQKMARFAFVR